MASGRPLLPAVPLPSDPRSAHPREPPPPSRKLPKSNPRRSLVWAACSACRRRKSKCDGERPACAACKASGKECVYDTGQGETRTAALKNMNSTLERNLNSATHALRMLQTSSDTEAERLFQRLRFAVDLPSFLSTLNLQHPLPPQPSPPCRQYAWIDIPGVLRYIRDNLEDIEHAFSIYIERTTMLFHVYTQDEVSGILALVHQPSLLDIPGPVLCEMCSIVAIASHFDRHRIPPDKSDLMYSVAKHFLDDLVLQNPLRAIKVCALLVLYNVVVKATVALTYVDVGLGIARNLGLYGQQRPQAIDHHSWLDAKRVWRSLILCKGWLQATLGYLPDESTSLVPDLCLGTSDVQDAAEFFRTEFTKISILKAKILGTATQPYLSQGSIDNIRRDLQSWYSSLPPQWGLSQNLADTDQSQTRITTSYLHLLHLGAIMLLHRRIVSNYLQLRTEDPRRALEAIQGAAEAVHEGITAARLSARLLALIMDEGGITRHCWICIFQSYIACCTLLYTGFHKRLLRRGSAEGSLARDGPDDDDDDVMFAERALAILSHCAKLDPGALTLERTLLPYSSMLKENDDDDDDDDDDAMQEDRETDAAPWPDVGDPPASAPSPSSPPSPAVATCFLPPSGTTPTHQACTELFEMLSKPFGTFTVPAAAAAEEEEGETPQVPLLQHTMTNVDELGLGMHLDWSGAASPASSFGGGCFAEGVQGRPFGWTRARSSAEHAEGAETLEIS